MRTIVHVNRHVIAFNKKYRTTLPVYTVKQGRKTQYCYSVVFSGPAWLVDTRDGRALSCGARAWVETDDPVVMVGPISFATLREMQAAIRKDTGVSVPELPEPSEMEEVT